jgi:hypothetical protein
MLPRRRPPGPEGTRRRLYDEGMRIACPDLPAATLPGPRRVIVVEPLEAPEERPVPAAPPPEREPAEPDPVEPDAEPQPA